MAKRSKLGWVPLVILGAVVWGLARAGGIGASTKVQVQNIKVTLRNRATGIEESTMKAGIGSNITIVAELVNRSLAPGLGTITVRVLVEELPSLFTYLTATQPVPAPAVGVVTFLTPGPAGSWGITSAPGSYRTRIQVVNLDQNEVLAEAAGPTLTVI